MPPNEEGRDAVARFLVRWAYPLGGLGAAGLLLLSLYPLGRLLSIGLTLVALIWFGILLFRQRSLRRRDPALFRVLVRRGSAVAAVLVLCAGIGCSQSYERTLFRLFLPCFETAVEEIAAEGPEAWRGTRWIGPWHARWRTGGDGDVWFATHTAWTGIMRVEYRGFAYLTRPEDEYWNCAFDELLELRHVSGRWYEFHGCAD